MLHIFVFRCQNCNLYCKINITNMTNIEMGYTSKFCIVNVSAKLPCRAFAILRESWDMIMCPDVVCLSDDSWQISHRFQNCFERDWNLSLVNISRPKPQTEYVNMTKMLIVLMIFGSRLLSSFQMSALYFCLKHLYYARNRQADKFEKYNSGLGFDRLGATNFQTIGEIATLVWFATHTMGTTGLNA